MDNWMVHFSSDSRDQGKYSIIRSDRIAVAEFKDHVDVKFILVHEGANLNYDGFYDEELQNSYKTLESKPITWEHGLKYNIGVINKAHYLNPGDVKNYLEMVSKLGISDLVAGETKKYILCEGTIWKDRFPEETLYMLDAYSNNSLYFSMENRFKYVECSKCKGTYDGPPYCEHLTNREIDGGAIRFFKEMSFRGASAVETPGDPDARALSFASKKHTVGFLQLLDKNDLYQDKELRRGFNCYIDDHLYDEEKCPCSSIADFPDDDLESMVWLFVCNKKNKELFDETISELKGEKMKEKYTQEEVDGLIKGAVDKAVQDALATYKKENDFTKEITDLKEAKSTLEKKMQELTDQNKTISEEKEKVEQSFVDFKAGIEKEKAVAGRLKELSDAKLVLDEDKVKEAISEMSDKQFTVFKETLIASAKKNGDDGNDGDGGDDELKKKLATASREDLLKLAVANISNAAKKNDETIESLLDTILR